MAISDIPTRTLRDYVNSLPTGDATSYIGSNLVKAIPGEGDFIPESDRDQFATAFQGSLAQTAVQPGDLPTFGDLATQDTISVPSDITATGTPSATTYLRGDGSWSTPAGGGEGTVNSVVEGTGINVNSSDPANPVVAIQTGYLSTVATTGAYADLTGKPTLGTAAATNSADYATAAQGTKADTALQPAAIGVALQGYDANTAKLNVSQQWVKPQRSGIFALTSGTTITIDGNTITGNILSLTLGTNATLANPTNLSAGTTFTIQGQQDATGSRTLAYGSNWKYIGGASPAAIPTAANAKFLISGQSWTDGTISFSVAGVGV